MSAGGLASAFTRATSSLEQWKRTSQSLGGATAFHSGVQNLARLVQDLTGAFRNCIQVSGTTVGKLKNHWQELDQWFRLNVTEPMVREVNAMLEQVAGGFNQVVSAGGFAITPLSVPAVPQLAQGAVLPANKPFLAMVGDQKNGTNVEAPLETIKQAVAEVVSNRDVVIQFSGDLAQLARVLRPAIAKESARVGGGLITREVV